MSYFDDFFYSFDSSMIMCYIPLHSPIHKNQWILVKWKDINMQMVVYIRSLIYANSFEKVKESVMFFYIWKEFFSCSFNANRLIRFHKKFAVDKSFLLKSCHMMITTLLVPFCFRPAWTHFLFPIYEFRLRGISCWIMTYLKLNNIKYKIWF